jgi:hypothetical protein
MATDLTPLAPPSLRGKGGERARLSCMAFLLLAGLLLLAGCGDTGLGGPTPTPVPVARPTAADAVVIRLSGGGGGMVASPIYNMDSRFPAFVLYGDGRLIYRTGDGFYQTHLDEAAVQRLVGVAVNDARFFTLPSSVGPMCCDMPSSQIEVHAAGQSGSVSFSILDPPSTPGADSDESRLSRLIDAIQALRVETAPAYQPAGVTLYADGGSPAGAGAGLLPWPVASVALSQALDASRKPGGGWTGEGLRLTGADATAVLKAAPSVKEFTQNGLRYYVVAVPDAP